MRTAELLMWGACVGYIIRAIEEAAKAIIKAKRDARAAIAAARRRAGV